jgi:parallel beta-helix repeat protein
MVDSPGEWAWGKVEINGKIYKKLFIYMPDGQPPGSRVLAAPHVRSVIDARGTTNLTLNNVRIVGGEVGVDASNDSYGSKTGINAAKNLKISNSEIAYSNWSGIYASQAEGLTVEKSDVVGSLHSGLYARTGSKSTVVKDSHFTNINNVGMHKGGDGAIFLNSDQGATVVGNTVTNAGKSGIFIGQSRNSLVKDNIVNGACRIHGDCGGIYLFNRPSDENPNPAPLNTQVNHNLVKNVNGDPVRFGSLSPERYAIYLDDYTSGATIANNAINSSDSGMQLHLAHDNKIIGNSFNGNLQRHVLFSDAGKRKPQDQLIKNEFSGNTFVGPAPPYFLAVGNPTTAATFNNNVYKSYNSKPNTIPSNVTVKSGAQPGEWID